MDESLTVSPVAAGSRLADRTTLRVGGPARRFVVAESEAEIVESIRAADAAGEPVLVLGGGSNVVISDDGFDGLVVQDARSSIDVDMIDSCGGASFRVAGGTNWDDVVVRAVSEGWVGFEALSGIPGRAGAAPVQNIGAYGQELSGVLASVRVYDRAERRVRLLALVELGFGYRSSLLKRSMYPDDVARPWYPTPRYVVLEVAFQTRLGDLSAPVMYPELARTLGVAIGERAPAGQVRDAVLLLRGNKGMLAEPPTGSGGAVDHDRWSAGSFFTNPIISESAAQELPADAPRFPVEPGAGPSGELKVKTSAAWLIEHAGFSRGFHLPEAADAASLSTKHTLAITNRGKGSAADVVALARTLRDGVREAFGISLVPEPVLIGLSL